MNFSGATKLADQIDHDSLWAKFKPDAKSDNVAFKVIDLTAAKSSLEEEYFAFYMEKDESDTNKHLRPIVTLKLFDQQISLDVRGEMKNLKSDIHDLFCAARDPENKYKYLTPAAFGYLGCR